MNIELWETIEVDWEDNQNFIWGDSYYIFDTSGIPIAIPKITTSIQENIIGIKIQATVIPQMTELPLDLTGIITATIVLDSPSLIRSEYLATVPNPSDGTLYYIFHGQINQSGTWKFQVKLIFLGKVLYTQISKFKVKVNI